MVLVKKKCLQRFVEKTLKGFLDNIIKRYITQKGEVNIV